MQDEHLSFIKKEKDPRISLTDIKQIDILMTMSSYGAARSEENSNRKYMMRDVLGVGPRFKIITLITYYNYLITIWNLIAR